MASCAVPPSLDAVLQLAAIETVVLAADVIDRLDLWNVIGRIDHEMLDAVLAHEPARGAVGDAAEHGAELFEGQQIGIGFELAFVLKSCHGFISCAYLSMAGDEWIEIGEFRGRWPPEDLRFLCDFTSARKNRKGRRYLHFCTSAIESADSSGLCGTSSDLPDGISRVLSS